MSLEMSAWIEQYRDLKARAERIRVMRFARLDRACADAGLGGYHGCTLHNAKIGLDTGRPWRGVDSSGLRYALRLERALFEADRVVTRWSDRTYPLRRHV